MACIQSCVIFAMVDFEGKFLRKILLRDFLGILMVDYLGSGGSLCGKIFAYA